MPTGRVGQDDMKKLGEYRRGENRDMSTIGERAGSRVGSRLAANIHLRWAYERRAELGR